jgi:hypothetical protein
MLLKRMLFEGRFTRPNLICGSSHPGEFIVPSTRRPAAKTGLLEERRLEIVVRRRGIKREKDSDSIAQRDRAEGDLWPVRYISLAP